MEHYELIAKAVISHARFPSPRGNLTVEDLFDLPLSSTTVLDLETVAQTLYKKMQELPKLSFTGGNAKDAADAAFKLDVVKTVIAYKQAERDKVHSESVRSQDLQTLLAEKSRRKEASITEISDEDLDKEIAKLRQAS